MKVRIDRLLVDRKLAASRERAQALILAGRVLVNNVKIEKAGAAVADTAEIRLLGEDLKYVSRGGLKLEKALAHWQIETDGLVCLDVGASTGGFTDCLLQHGAALVIAVDTGYGQMALRLREDPRVRLLEKTNARFLQAEDLQRFLERQAASSFDRKSDIRPRGIALVVLDVSFISATLVLPAVIKAAFPKQGGAGAEGMSGEFSSGARIIVLVKPQFEVGRKLVGKGGIVRDPTAQAAAVEKVRQKLRDLGFTSTDVIESPILGAEGNREFLLYGTL
jgi:23S rRNA (cytidine1920-2'-O)/16S rRNA (cytidine1409-2'-O)-methyltransferase